MKTTGRIFAMVVVVAAAAGAGWWFFGRGRGNGMRAGAGQVSVRWGGKYQGSMSLPATLNWCPVTRIGVLEGISGDSGIAVVLYERDSLLTGPHAVASPELAASATRPIAAVVMRWMHLRPDTALAGFRSEGGGTVRIRFAGGRASGDVNARLRSAISTDTITVTGVFTGVPVVATAKGCT